MFAVQGWNVSTSGLVQQQAKRSATGAPAQAGNESRKRKRPDRDSGVSRKIEGGELEKLWNQRFGDEKSTKKAGKEDRHDDRRRDSHETTQSPALATKRSTHPENKKKLYQRDHSSPGKANGSKSTTTTIKHDKNKKQGRGQKSNAHNASESTDTSSIVDTLPPPPPPATNLTPLQAKMRAKLTSARFRHLNETLYTTPSSTALSLFTNTPSLFAEYHAGFSQQVSSSWPHNPVLDFIAAIKARGPLSPAPPDPLPRRKTGSCTIADLGCGDAPLARGLIPGPAKKMKLTIHSYDLHAPNQHVTVADIANLPLRDGEADIAVFSLSLMGTNWIDFVEEAWRVLRGDGKGEVWVAEVKSRFARGGDGKYKKGEAVAHSVGKQRKPLKGKKAKNTKGGGEEEEGDEADLPVDLFTSEASIQPLGDTPDLRPFINIWTSRGFQLKPNSIDAKNKMFVSMTFFKSGIPTVGKHRGMKWNGKEYERIGKANGEDDTDTATEGKVLKPCVYKLR
ncbi:uncharacterized protein HMPREF1541_00940 [Cyphellophora europaea CBS 101466]|uniref:Ribosomal RNA-processing protein 8 n=1 Tax=Cyphellophora europaea (strain CBS 101466) TaxID=1220924 RepID=W2SDE3_CYPE1|nr:uncharacterized protein HMPREF1541_00940 [Cyphellophora europaea CBS 101466]ETN46751.1 hypothetical protein HMPREF1541_00940 [Cyphellophora europaea CBS 101466]